MCFANLHKPSRYFVCIGKNLVLIITILMTDFSNAVALRLSNYFRVLFKTIILVNLCTALPIALSAQQFAQFPTPNAAAMTVFDQYPQGDYTGVPAISIPVYTFDYQGFSIPIT